MDEPMVLRSHFYFSMSSNGNVSSDIPMSGHSQFDYFCFDAEIDYAQVLAEAQRHQEGEEASSLSHLKAPLDQLHKRKSWKSSLFFWRRSSEKKKHMNGAIPEFKSQPKPIYMNDIAPSYRFSRPNSTPLAAMYSAMQRNKTDAPYTPLVPHSHSNRRVSLSRPIYLVT